MGCCDALHQRILQPGFESINHSRIAMKGPLGKGVDLMELELHLALPGFVQ